MGTSENNGAVLFDTAELSTDRFIDTVMFRDFLSTAMHKADEAAQHVMTWVAPDATYWESNLGNPWLEPQLTEAQAIGGTGANAQRYFAFGIKAVWTPKVRAIGDAYSVRVRLAGSSSGGGNCDFGVVILPRSETGPSGAWGAEPTWPRKMYTGITSTSGAWLTPDDGDHMITDVDAEIMRAAADGEGAWSTLTDIGGTVTTHRMPMLQAIVIGQTRLAGSIPRLHGISVHEFVGAV